MKKLSKQNIIVIAIIVIMVVLVKFLWNITIIKPFSKSSELRYGLIDGEINDAHKNVIMSNDSNNANNNNISHGDNVLNFLGEVVPSESFYYYNAEVNGRINTKSIINGLDWMVSNNVDCVTISLSCKVYAPELEKWIHDNADNIKVFASYNNSINTYDYPANYNDVIGVGTIEVINKKETDILFRSSKIIVCSFPVKIYEGNSYLAPYVMLKYY